MGVMKLIKMYCDT